MRDCVLYLRNDHNMTAMRVNSGRIIRFLRLNPRFAVIFFAVFYLVGIFGTLISSSHNFFLLIFPWALLLSFLVVLLYNKSEIDLRTIMVVAITAVSGFLIEVAGISTHLIFGNYTYGNTLGLKLFETPLIIGVNWALLVFATGSVVHPLKIPVVARILFASLLMVIYDILLEFAAPLLGMWSWADDSVPLRNYVAWFVIAAGFHSLFKVMRIKTYSSLALPVLICQVVFFIVLIVYNGLAG
jgi:putative membrane protein